MLRQALERLDSIGKKVEEEERASESREQMRLKLLGHESLSEESVSIEEGMEGSRKEIACDDVEENTVETSLDFQEELAKLLDGVYQRKGFYSLSHILSRIQNEDDERDRLERQVEDLSAKLRNLAVQNWKLKWAKAGVEEEEEEEEEEEQKKEKKKEKKERNVEQVRRVLKSSRNHGAIAGDGDVMMCMPA